METLRMLDEKPKEAIVVEPKTASGNDPQSLGVDNADELVKGKIDLDDLAMVVAGAVAGGP
jgi:hypothetical protein